MVDVPLQQMILTTPYYLEVIVGMTLYLIDRKTGKVVKVIPLEVGPKTRNIEVLAKATDMLTVTGGIEEFREFDAGIAKVISTSVQALEKEMEKYIKTIKE